MLTGHSDGFDPYAMDMDYPATEDPAAFFPTDHQSPFGGGEALVEERLPSRESVSSHRKAAPRFLSNLNSVSEVRFAVK